jgi:hypothetical protein
MRADPIHGKPQGTRVSSVFPPGRVSVATHVLLVAGNWQRNSHTLSQLALYDSLSESKYVRGPLGFWLLTVVAERARVAVAVFDVVVGVPEDPSLWHPIVHAWADVEAVAWIVLVLFGHQTMVWEHVGNDHVRGGYVGKPRGVALALFRNVAPVPSDRAVVEPALPPGVLGMPIPIGGADEPLPKVFEGFAGDEHLKLRVLRLHSLHSFVPIVFPARRHAAALEFARLALGPITMRVVVIAGHKDDGHVGQNLAQGLGSFAPGAVPALEVGEIACHHCNVVAIPCAIHAFKQRHALVPGWVRVQVQIRGVAKNHRRQA